MFRVSTREGESTLQTDEWMCRLLQLEARFEQVERALEQLRHAWSSHQPIPEPVGAIHGDLGRESSTPKARARSRSRPRANLGLGGSDWQKDLARLLSSVQDGTTSPSRTSWVFSGDDGATHRRSGLNIRRGQEGASDVNEPVCQRSRPATSDVGVSESPGGRVERIATAVAASDGGQDHSPRVVGVAEAVPKPCLNQTGALEEEGEPEELQRSVSTGYGSAMARLLF